MANSIALFSVYVKLLDDVYKSASKSAVLESDPALLQQTAEASEFKVPKISMNGLGDYSRTNGYVKGDATLAYETKQADYDRGRSFNIDRMDNAESAGIAFGKLSSEFIRTWVAPELDAYRFAKYCAKAGHVTAAALADGAAALAALEAGLSTVDESEVPEEQRFLFITPTLLNSINDLDTTKSRAALNRFMQTNIIRVPQGRFYSVIDLRDGSTTGEEAGGYIKNATSGKNIDFMIVHKPAVMQYTKNVVNKVISPDDNQEMDAWKFFYRNYGLADAFDNKVNGIYVHTGA